ncbi:VCBS repeat-containing protein [Pseudoalteromonas sp. BDTF-M6]|uniref:FG-GAP repeat domain-containing protein n=1 Tax=Pseudoalteromonas sp. BDTF-M6 TaxID=2796132 RepID=UPI001BAF3E5F|nr:VCBS repeat-containing protein [Pseudoalteromonas sp. BDTF-M6]MBS3796131.1 VCBS repeat-containing protein [Pseudoalteromonas sp. BDTF-M6]
MTNRIVFTFFTLLFFVVSSNVVAKTIEIGEINFSPRLFHVGDGQPSISVCDFNSDGNKDIIVSNYLDNNIAIFQGNGKGDLSELARFPVGENPTDMAVSDINKDGNVDVAIANHETSYVTLLFGDGKGGFNKASQSPLNIGIKPHPHEVQLQDLDGDNIAELIVDSRDNDGLLVLKGLANGQFKTPGKIINVGGDPYRGFAVADINGDRALDLVTPNQSDIGIAVNSGSNNTLFSLTKMGLSASPFSVELADLTDDGKLDLVVATNGRFLSVLPGDGQGSFHETQKTVIATTSGAKQVATGDINGDRIQDALVANWSGELTAIIGNKTTLESYTFKHTSIPNPWAVALVDLNKDGKSDFIIADGNSSLAAVYISQKR